MERFRLASYYQGRVLVVGPRAVRVDRDLDAIIRRLERVRKERIRADAALPQKSDLARGRSVLVRVG